MAMSTTEYLNKDTLFMSMACLTAMASKDPSTKVGAVIVGLDDEVISLGYNGFPRKVEDLDKERYKRPQKYYWIEHAERNAIYNAARIGVSCRGAKMYTPFYPCPDCTRGIIQSGIKEVIVHSKIAGYLIGTYTLEEEKLNTTFKMLEESGVEIRGIKVEIPNITITVSGKQYK
jgi:dCMP deaminase